jgi:hypothetical protein
VSMFFGFSTGVVRTWGEVQLSLSIVGWRVGVTVADPTRPEPKLAHQAGIVGFFGLSSGLVARGPRIVQQTSCVNVYWSNRQRLTLQKTLFVQEV